MEKYKFYYLIKVHYDRNSHKKHIVSCQLFGSDEADKIPLKKVAISYPRSQIIDLIKSTDTVYTAIKSNDYEYKKALKVEVYTRQSFEYIRTEGNILEEDNLENLPEY